MKISVSLNCINCGNETIVCETGLNEYEVYLCERCSQDDEKNTRVADLENKIECALEIIVNYGLTDGAHHKMWVIDQVARKLLGDFDYGIWVDEDWDKGIAP